MPVVGSMPSGKGIPEFMRRNSILFLIALTISWGASEAQEYRYELGVTTGAVGYLGDANPRIPFASPGGGVMVQARYNFNFRIVGYLSLGYQLFTGKTTLGRTDFPETVAPRFSTSALLLNPAFEYNFYPYSDKFSFLGTKRLSPYISLGLALGLGFEYKGRPFFMPGFSGAVGLKYKVANRWNLQLQLGGIHFFTDKLDSGGNALAASLDNPYGLSKQPWKGNDGAVMLLLGVTYEFGRRVTECFTR